MEHFPPKPIPEERKSSLSRTLGSMVFFMLAFYLWFDWDLGYLLLLVGVLGIHELGHFSAMRKFGYKDVKMFFLPLVGAYVSGEKTDISQKQRSIVILAGPIPGIILGIVMLGVSYYQEIDAFIIPAYMLLLLNGFNLLPLTPLDGGRLVETLFFARNDTIQTYFLAISCLGLIALCFFLKTYILLIIPFFLLMQLNAQNRIKKVRKTLQEKGILLRKAYEALTDEEYWLIRAEVIRNSSLLNKMEPDKYEQDPKENWFIQQVKGILQTSFSQDLTLIQRVGILVLWIASILVPLALASFWQLP